MILMININNFLKKMNRLNKIFYNLPHGIFTEDNEYINKTEMLIPHINFSIGSPLKIKKVNFNSASKNNLSDFMEEAGLYKSGPFKSVDENDLTIDMILNEIHEFEFDKKRNPFENYLELMVLKYLMESISSKKSLLSGIWGSKEALARSTGHARGNFSDFICNMEEKNAVLHKIRERINFYPEIFFDHLDEYESGAFNVKHSQYSTFLELRILQIKYKIYLQDRCTQANIMSADIKAKFDERINIIRKLLHTFPVEYI